MPPRLYLEAPLQSGAELELPPEAARHVQVLRLQPGHALTLFNGDGGEWSAEVTAMGRQSVAVRVGERDSPARELPLRVTVALGMPANERMDALVEKATELGLGALQPLHCARSVLRLQGERAQKRRAHWQGVAVAAAEQSGRTQVPAIAAIDNLSTWLAALPVAQPGQVRWLLSLAPDAQALRHRLDPSVREVLTLSGPEGGLDPQEESLARQQGFVPLSLGPRVLRADTAPLAVLSALGLL